MEWSLGFIFNCVLLGVGLAMDAFSVSVANGLNEPCMRKRKMGTIAGVFAFFQFLMPVIGWICVHTVAERFEAFQKFIPWIALVLLVYIGGGMLKEAFSGEEECCEPVKVNWSALIVQGIATSIDALSVGFAIAYYNFVQAFVCGVVIAIVTFFICMAGVIIGKTVGAKFSRAAAILGGVILIIIGLEVFITGVF